MHRLMLIALSVLASLASVAPPFASSAHAGMNHNETFLLDRH